MVQRGHQPAIEIASLGDLPRAQRHQLNARLPEHHTRAAARGERAFSKERRDNSANRRGPMKPYSLAKLLHAFFHEWMGQQRNLSRHTVLSYRDTWKLLLRFVSERNRREITALSLSDLETAEVLAFLQHLENDRKVSIGTRNCRLAAIHSFFAFAARREPLAIAQCGEIARIPVKKMKRPAMCYLDAEEITAILRQ